MRKITMKRKSKSNENTKNSTEPAEEEVQDVQQENQDKDDTINSNAAETENGTSKKSKTKKSKTEVNYTESNDEEEESNASVKSEKRSSKKKNKKGRKSKSTNVVEESNGTGENDDNKTEEEEAYEVEQVMDQKNVKGAKYYLIRWKGYGEESDTWEPESTLDCADLLAKFLNSRKSNKGRKRSSVSNAKSPKKSKTDAEDDNEETVGEYEVDRILEVHHKKNGQREFLVHWKGYNANDNTWEPEENMSCHDLIERFMEKVNKARASDTRELRVNRKPTNHFTLSMQQSGRRLSRRNLGKQRAQYHELD